MVQWDVVGPIIATVGAAALGLAWRLGGISSTVQAIAHRVTRIESILDTQERSAGRRPPPRRETHE